MYKVIDVAKLFSVSKVTIYKKISAKKAELKGHVIKKKNVTYLDDEAVEIIKNSLQVNKEKVSGRLIDEELNQTYEDLRNLKEMNNRLRAEKISMLNDQIVDLESSVRHMTSQVTIKEHQLRVQDEILGNFEHLLASTKKRIRTLEEAIQAFEL